MDALIVCRGNVVQRQDLRLPQPPAGAQLPPAAGLDLIAQALRQLLNQRHPQLYEALEELIVRTAFEHCGSNQVRTARELGLSRNILRAQLKRFGLLGERLVRLLAPSEQRSPGSLHSPLVRGSIEQLAGTEP